MNNGIYGGGYQTWGSRTYQILYHIFLSLVVSYLPGLKEQKQTKTTSERLFIIILLFSYVSLFRFLLLN